MQFRGHFQSRTVERRRHEPALTSQKALEEFRTGHLEAQSALKRRLKQWSKMSLRLACTLIDFKESQQLVTHNQSK